MRVGSPGRKEQYRLWHWANAVFAAAVIVVAPSLTVMANPPVPTPDVVPVFQHIGVSNGLAQSTVTAIAQGPVGYMWFATEAGLQRYDGYGYVAFRHNPTDPHSLSGGTVSSLAFSANDTLWIGSTNGLDRLLPGQHSFTHYRHHTNVATSLSSNSVETVLVDRSDRLWVGTAAGLDRLQSHARFRHYHLPGKDKALQKVTALFQDRNGRIWVGTVNGLFYYAPRVDQLRRYHVPEDSQAYAALTHSRTEAIYESTDNRLWVGTRTGLAVLGDVDGKVRFFSHHRGDRSSLPTSWVSGIVEDGTGRIWVATYGGGLSRFDGYKRGFRTFRHSLTDPASLSSNYLFNIMRDSSGLVWVGTDGAGINYYNPRSRAFGRFRHEPGNPQSLANNFVWAVYESPEHELWVASDGGLTQIDSTRTHFKQIKLPSAPVFNGEIPSVKVLYADHQQRLWMGTGHGVYRYLPASHGFRYYSLGERSRTDWLGASVNMIFEDSRNRLWIGTNNGLVQLNPHSGKVLYRYSPDKRYPGSLRSPGVWALCQAGDNSLWIGTTRGLLSFDPEHGSFSKPLDENGHLDVLASSDILDCRMAADGSLWVGTTTGLAHFVPNVGTLRRYTEANGLTSAMIYSVLPGPRGDIWVGTSRGLARIDPSKHTVRNYDVENGLYNEEFNEGAAYAGSNDTLYFGSINGLAVIHLNALGAMSPSAPVVITGLRVMGDSVPLNTPKGTLHSISVPYDRDSFSVRVAVLDFALPDRNRFKYRLDGFDHKWHQLHEGHTITYTNLDPGHYTLRVIGAGGDGVWSQQEARFGISILPPPWETWWAYLLYVFAAVSAAITVLYLFARRIRQKRDLAYEQRRRAMAEAQQALIEAVSPLQGESDISRVFLERLPALLVHERAVFFVDEASGLRLVADSGLGQGERERVALWPLEHASCLGRLRQRRTPCVLTATELGSLERRIGVRRCHYLALPLLMANGLMHVLIIGRQKRAFDSAECATASILCNQLGVMFEKAHLIHQLEDMATTDSLTGVYTRRAFTEYAEVEFSRCVRYGHPLSVLMLDIDHFKRINDTCGHTIGDEVLRAISQTCCQTLREPDLMGRYGGEEFIVCLPETDPEQAGEVAERMRQAVKSHPFRGGQREFSVTVSIGMATSDGRLRNLQELIKAADEALYTAKRKGRDCVVAGS